ncbi:hypothetical protein PR048_029404 [Dryococelus australis]|uniref:Uncharacterized protein n=1 Tax=Dryococelus australis TaxID=614101 RepID=A0ABQ9GDA7_9NEOP|nr:hypothetical protein PR048_029404 [Dryococelus australis]
MILDLRFEPPTSVVRNKLHLDLQSSSELEWCNSFLCRILDPISDRVSNQDGPFAANLKFLEVLRVATAQHALLTSNNATSLVNRFRERSSRALNSAGIHSRAPGTMEGENVARILPLLPVRGTAVEQWVGYSPPTLTNRARIPARSLPDFCMWESSAVRKKISFILRKSLWPRKIRVESALFVPVTRSQREYGDFPGFGRRVFLGISCFSPHFHSGTAAYSPRFTLIGSQYHDAQCVCIRHVVCLNTREGGEESCGSAVDCHKSSKLELLELKVDSKPSVACVSHPFARRSHGGRSERKAVIDDWSAVVKAAAPHWDVAGGMWTSLLRSGHSGLLMGRSSEATRRVRRSAFQIALTRERMSDETYRVCLGLVRATAECKGGKNGRAPRNPPPPTCERRRQPRVPRAETRVTPLGIKGPRWHRGQTTRPPPRRIGFDSRRGNFQIFTRGNRAGRCLWSAGFLEDLPCFPPPLHSGAVPYSPSFTLIGSQDLVVKTHPNLFTPSPSTTSPPPAPRQESNPIHLGAMRVFRLLHMTTWESSTWRICSEERVITLSYRDSFLIILTAGIIAQEIGHRHFLKWERRKSTIPSFHSAVSRESNAGPPECELSTLPIDQNSLHQLSQHGQASDEVARSGFICKDFP